MQPDEKTIKDRLVLPIVVVVLLIVAGLMLWFFVAESDSDDNQQIAPTITNFTECAAAGYPIMESYPRQCATPEGNTFTEELTGPVQFNSEKGVLIELNDFQSREKISSPLTVTGRVPGNWSFEAVFPVVLTDWDGLIIAEGQAQLQDDWMTDELVPFEVTLEFETPTYRNNGALILQKDNPSDLPENDDALEIPVLFE